MRSPALASPPAWLCAQTFHAVLRSAVPRGPLSLGLDWTLGTELRHCSSPAPQGTSAHFLLLTLLSAMQGPCWLHALNLMLLCIIPCMQAPVSPSPPSSRELEVMMLLCTSNPLLDFCTPSQGTGWPQFSHCCCSGRLPPRWSRRCSALKMSQVTQPQPCSPSHCSQYPGGRGFTCQPHSSLCSSPPR